MEDKEGLMDGEGGWGWTLLDGGRVFGGGGGEWVDEWVSG